jgi:SOS-response transcriptional repressor LexA
MSRPRLVEHDDRIVSFVRTFRRDHGYGPSFREIADDSGVSVSTAASIIARLCHEGRLSQVPRLPRTVTVPQRKAVTQ